MKIYRIELRYVGVVFVEADGVMESEFSITFHKDGTVVASYPAYAISAYGEVPSMSVSERRGHNVPSLPN
ncbi:hypothetical protein DES53_107277 [Roseimicrobium gellanilyticum]|uniref:Uncharacterized protein n=1 Tax=Roseimicrobium gellanilyticum TaxID=748857 RepID=A0A366HHY5_9BACT|nr:hypothetical protein [Roseimicrobium gellanilyticum]RBP41445.1 hypothetical protein DES53_107277 [Roseimicrobium gellanilyticum]